MPAQTGSGPWWVALTVWGVVNGVNMLQAAGFISWTRTGRAHAGWLQWIGPAAFLAFVSLMVVVDYIWPVQFRSPARYAILVPYLVLFFGAILLMGLPMYRLNRGLWLITAATTLLLLGSMGLAMRRGVG